MPYGFWGQKVKGQGHIAVITENGICCIVALSSQPKIMKTKHTTVDSPWVEDMP